MPFFVCETCGVQYPDAPQPPAVCPICEDERQYVGPKGQRWTTVDELRARHRADVREEEPGLIGLGCKPPFAIGQRALLVRTPGGNVLWDCITLVDDALVGAVEERGGATAIAISHPHYYSSMADWSAALGGVPVYIHAADRRWVQRADNVVLWDGETCELGDGLTLIRCGGHFAGGTVLHWRDGADGRGLLLSGDIVMPVPDRGWVSFMYSYPNLIPLDAQAVRGVVAALEPFAFERIRGAWFDRVVPEDAKAAVSRSAERYLRAIGAA